MEYEQLMEEAHRRHGTALSVESQVVPLYPDDDYILVGARVTTEQGGFNGWAECMKGGVVDAEHKAVVEALYKAGVFDTNYYPKVVEELSGTPEDFNPQEPVDEEGLEGEAIVCEGAQLGLEECKNGGFIKPYYAGTLTLTPSAVAERTTKRHGKAVCADCSSALIFKARRK